MEVIDIDGNVIDTYDKVLGEITDQRPRIEITAPADGAVLSGIQSIKADASDDNGIVRVDFYINNAWVASEHTAPYTIEWYSASLADGVHEIKVTATDTVGQKASASLTVTVDNTGENQPPLVEILKPSEGSTVSGTVLIAAEISDDDEVTEIAFVVDNLCVHQKSGNPYEYTWDTAGVSNGTHRLKVTARDRNGQEGSDEVEVTVYNHNPDAIGDLSDFVLYAHREIKIQGIADSYGNIGSNRKLTIGKGASGVIVGSIQALGIIEVDGSITINGDVTTNARVDIDRGDLKVTGNISEGADLAPLALSSALFSARGRNVVVPKRESLDLEPGSYKKVELNRKAKIRLFHGDYYIRSFNTDRDAKIVVDLSEGPVTINVTKELDIAKRVEIQVTGSGNGNGPTITYLGRRKIEIEKGAIFNGTLIAPRAKVKLDKGSTLYGAVYALQISLDNGVSFSPAP
jgi:cytoskeletal protein CcmA (bactofilin family)